MRVPLQCLQEAQPDGQWQTQFKRVWPSYRKWYERGGLSARPGFLTSSSALSRAMPELVPLYEKLCELAGGGDLEARFLSLYCPPAFMSGCTQVAWTKGEPVLIRNYDYNPQWFEGIFWHTNWLQPVLGMSDCTWGLLDGVNGSGLCASLTFGGRKVTGKGFGVPLVVRYVLETCSTVDEALKALGRVPIHMAYNIMLMDKAGAHAAAFLGPDRDMGISRSPVCSNHQEKIDWPEYARATATSEREKAVEEYLSRPRASARYMADRFLKPPLYNTDYEQAFGTLYTAIYEPRAGKATLRWPEQALQQSLTEFQETTLEIKLQKPMTRARARKAGKR